MINHKMLILNIEPGSMNSDSELEISPISDRRNNITNDIVSSDKLAVFTSYPIIVSKFESNRTPLLYNILGSLMRGLGIIIAIYLIMIP